VQPRPRSPCRGAPRHWTDHTSSLKVGWLAQGAAALSSSCGFRTPPWPGARHLRRHGARVQPRPRSPYRGAPRHWTDHTSGLKPRGGLACTGGCGAELELRVLHAPVDWRATPAPTRCPRAASASVALSRSTSTLDRPHLKPRGGPQGAVALSSSCGFCTPPWPGARHLPSLFFFKKLLNILCTVCD